MKRYWKGLTGTIKEGQYGTYDDGGTVPDSEEVSKIEYDDWAAKQPAPEKNLTAITITNTKTNTVFFSGDINTSTNEGKAIEGIAEALKSISTDISVTKVKK